MLMLRTQGAALGFHILRLRRYYFVAACLYPIRIVRAPSFVTQRDYRIDFRSKAGRDKTGSKSDSCEDNRADDERQRVGDDYSQKLALQQSPRRQRET